MAYAGNACLDQRIEQFDNESPLFSSFFAKNDLKIFTMLISRHLSLPVYLGDTWRCYDCIFESHDLNVMAKHIIKNHKPLPECKDQQ